MVETVRNASDAVAPRPRAVNDLIEETSDVKWANLQRTQSGAIVYFRVRLEVYGMPCASQQTRGNSVGGWTRELHLGHPEGVVLLELTSTPSTGTLLVLEGAFGPQSVSKVHV